MCQAADHYYYNTAGFHDNEITELPAVVRPFLPKKAVGTG
jgi:hypothetical protein